MRADAFTNPSGLLVGIGDGCHAFVPRLLPLELPPMTIALVRVQLEAANALGQLQQALQHSGLDANMVLYSLVRREAVLSSAIENTYTTPEQLALFSMAGGAKGPDSSTHEVWNHFNAMSFALQSLGGAADGAIISGPLLRNAHKELMRGLADFAGRAGEYRTTQSKIGIASRPMSEARFVPPPPSEVQPLMENLLTFSNGIKWGAEDQAPYIDLAVQHYQFETIHPFADGNGRLGRFLTTLTMTTSGLLAHPLIYISAWLHKNKAAYVDLMLGVSQRSEWIPWIQFFVKAIEQSALDGVRVCNSLLELREKFYGQVGARLWPAVDLLFREWLVTAAEVAKVTDKTSAMAHNYLGTMEAKGMVSRVSGARRPVQYMSRPVLDIVFDGAPRAS